MQNKINKLIKYSKIVLNECSLENGAIVAGNPGNPKYSKDAPNYYYVWPRDASFNSVASNILGLTQNSEKFFDWCLERGCDKNGMLWQHYTPNGGPAGFFVSELYNNKKIDQISKYIHPDAKYPISNSLRSQLQPDGNGTTKKRNQRKKVKIRSIIYNY